MKVNEQPVGGADGRLFIAADGSLSAAGRESTTVLVAVDDRGAVEACTCTKKGPQDTYAIKVTTNFIDGLGGKTLMSQTDAENAIQGMARAIAKDAVPTETLRTTPRYSHQSNGRVENEQDTCRAHLGCQEQG